MVLKKPAPAAGKGTPPGATGNAAAPKGAPPRAAGKAPAPVESQPNRTPKRFEISRGARVFGDRIVIFGSGGVGKSTLCAAAPKSLFIDLQAGTERLDVARIDSVETFQDLRDVLHSYDLLADFECIHIDTFTDVQELSVREVVATVKHEKGHAVTSIEGYGFGKGYRHVLEKTYLILADIDTICKTGKNVSLICHSTVEKAPNPEGEDFIRYEPDLFQPPKIGRIRDAVKGWCDHMLFMDFDKFVVDGKAKGHGSRTVYFDPLPHFWAKSRNACDPLQCTKENGPMIWDAILNRTED